MKRLKSGVRRGIPGLLVLLAVVIISAVLWASVPAYAATTSLYPNGNGTTGLTNSAGTQVDNYTYVDEATADDDTTYVVNTAAQAATGLYALQDSTVSYATINSVTVYIRAKQTQSGGVANTYI